MIKEDERIEFSNILNQLGIKDTEEQKKVIDFLYTFGTIVYDFTNKIK